ncbi:MAG TPA: GyrI-like domain-containing protein [Acidobacteriaceae bacterium]|jgi:AraC family transcriptional regulator
MKDQPIPVFQTMETISLVGTMAIYSSQAEASHGIPEQWCMFLKGHPSLGNSAKLHGASPCTSDRKIHYLTGVVQEDADNVARERITLEAGEYAVVRVDDATKLRDTWIWLLTSWLDGSGRRERNAPEFERYTAISESGTPTGPVEIWIPLEPLDAVAGDTP